MRSSAAQLMAECLVDVVRGKLPEGRLPDASQQDIAEAWQGEAQAKGHRPRRSNPDLRQNVDVLNY